MMDTHDFVLQLVIENGYRDLCEIGVWKGCLARRLGMLARTLVLVDPWSALWNDFEHNGVRYNCTMGEGESSQWQLNNMYKELTETLPNALILRMPSMEAAMHVPPCSLDFVYIDAVHTYEHCLADITTWLSKLRPGGMICGDDYVPQIPGTVAQAVDQVFGKKERGGIWWEKLP